MPRHGPYLDGNRPDSGCSCETVAELDVVDGVLFQADPCKVHGDGTRVRALGGVLVDVRRESEEPVRMRGLCQQCGNEGHDHRSCPNHGTVDGLYIGGRPCAV